MSFLLGTATEVKKELDSRGVGEFDEVSIKAILETKSGKAIMLVEVSEPAGGDF